MKKRTIHVFPILLVFLLLLVGCRNSGQEPRAEWDQEAGILTVDGVRYRKDETLAVSYTHLTLPTICSV